MFLDIMKSEPLYYWFAGDVTAAILVVKNKQKHFISLGSNLNFHLNPSRKQFYCIDPQHGRLVTWLQTKNTHIVT